MDQDVIPSGHIVYLPNVWEFLGGVSLERVSALRDAANVLPVTQPWPLDRSEADALHIQPAHGGKRMIAVPLELEFHCRIPRDQIANSVILPGGSDA